MKAIPKRPFFESWKIGIKEPAYAAIAYSAFWTLSIFPTISSSPESSWIAPALFFILWLIAIILFAPVGVSFFPISKYTQRRVADELEPIVDRILDSHVLNWAESAYGQVDALVKSGDKSAAKQIRNTMGLTWDQADAAIKDWPMTVLKAKLDAIEKAVAEPNSELVSA